MNLRTRHSRRFWSSIPGVQADWSPWRRFTRRGSPEGRYPSAFARYRAFWSRRISRRRPASRQTSSTGKRAQAAQEQEQLYEILLTAMEQAELVLGGQEMELELFLQMFRMLLGCYQVGSIPANLDEVLVGSLDAMRALR